MADPVAIAGNMIINSVGAALRNAFSTSLLKSIYRNTAVQNMEKPCAYVHQISHSSRQQMRHYQHKNYLVDVRIHPADGDDKTVWLHDMEEKVTQAINKIQVNSRVVASEKINTYIEDDVLHVIAVYNLRVVQETATETLMQTVEVKI